MKRLNRSLPWLLSAALLSFSALFYSSCRVSYYFIDKQTFRGASVAVLVLLIAGFCAALAGFLLREKACEKAKKALFIAAVITLLIGTAVNIAYAVMGWEMWGDFAYYIKKSLPYFFFIWFALLCLIVLPRVNIKLPLKWLSALACICLFAVSVFGLQCFRLSAEPTVLVKNTEEYSVVWATSHPSTGKLEVVENGTTHTYYDEVAGNMRTDDRVHRITVPAKVLNTCEYYSVTSQRVVERTGYSLWAGKTVQSRQYHFKAPAEDARKLNIWTLSDWHEHPALAQQAAENFPQADVLVMGGDALNEVDDQAGVVRNLLAPCAALSGSEIPVIFLRGNHECRGDYSVNLLTDLGLESFYFAYRLGSMSGVVLDMGECYGDDFVEYLSLADYESYRDAQENWLSGLEPLQTSYHISFCHDELFEEAAEGRADRTPVAEALGRLDTHLLVSGHLHESILRQKGELHRGFYTFVDGGINKDHSFSAGLIEIDGAAVTVKTVNSSGETELQECFEINE